MKGGDDNRGFRFPTGEVFRGLCEISRTKKMLHVDPGNSESLILDLELGIATCDSQNSPASKMWLIQIHRTQSQDLNSPDLETFPPRPNETTQTSELKQEVWQGNESRQNKRNDSSRDLARAHSPKAVESSTTALSPKDSKIGITPSHICRKTERGSDNFRPVRRAYLNNNNITAIEQFPN